MIVRNAAGQVIRPLVDIPSGGDWPFWTAVAKWIGEIQFGAIMAFVVFLIIAIVVFAGGKAWDRSGMKATGVTGIIVALIGVAFVASAPALVTYFASVNVG